MNLIDSQMTNPLIGLYCGITFLVLANILVALLASSVTRIYDQAIAYNVFQRATTILSEEKSWKIEERKSHIDYIRGKSCNPIKAPKYELVQDDVRIMELQSEVEEQKKILKTMVIYLFEA